MNIGREQDMSIGRERDIHIRRRQGINIRREQDISCWERASHAIWQRARHGHRGRMSTWRMRRSSAITGATVTGVATAAVVNDRARDEKPEMSNGAG